MPRIELGELIRLYRHLSLEEIAREYGGTKQGLSERLRRGGVRMRPRGYRVKPSPYQILKGSLDVQRLVRSYVQDKQSILFLAKGFGCSHQTIRRILESEGIEIRRCGWSVTRKYPEIYALQVNQSVIMRHPHNRRGRSAIYSAARRAKYRISLNKIAENTFRITRVK